MQSRLPFFCFHRFPLDFGAADPAPTYRVTERKTRIFYGIKQSNLNDIIIL